MQETQISCLATMLTGGSSLASSQHMRLAYNFNMQHLGIVANANLKELKRKKEAALKG